MVNRLLEDEIQAAIDGFREERLYQLGGIEPFVRRLLAKSQEGPGATQKLEQALNGILLREDLLSTGDPDRLRLLIELCGAYAPSRGASKLLEFVDRLEGQPVYCDIGADRRIDLHARAFHALQRYYPAPATAEDEQYAFYVDVLRGHTRYEHYAGYVIARMLYLRALKISERLFEDSLSTFPDAVLPTTIELFLQPSRKYFIAQTLGEIYSVCSRKGLRPSMRRALEGLGIETATFDSHPIVIVSGQSIVLEITTEQQTRVLTTNSRRFQNLDPDFITHSVEVGH